MKCVLTCIILIVSSLQLNAQIESLFKDDSIARLQYAPQVGKIIFADHDTSPEEALAQSLHHYTLTNKSDLFINVFMQASLSNVLHELSPSSSIDELDSASDYQFSLLIDGKLIYQSDLLPGAPRPAQLHIATIISKPLVDNRNPGGYWSQSFFNRFLYNGGDSTLTDGEHLLRMEIRGYVRQPAYKVSGLLASGDLPMTVKRMPVIDPFSVQINNPGPYQGLPVSNEGYDTMPVKMLKARIEDGLFKNISSIVVLKQGKILVEEYFNGNARDSVYDVRSVGKSFASTMMGIAIGQGLVKGERQHLSDFYDLHQYKNYDPCKDSITLHDLLTMSSAFDGDDAVNVSPGNEENMYPTGDWVKFALDLPVVPARCQQPSWQYFTAGAVVLGDVLEHAVPGGLEAYAQKKLFEPLGIKKVYWQHTPQHVANTAGGIQMNALDFAKYGQLYKNGGRLNGRQVIPAAWVKNTFTKHMAIGGRVNEYYGLLFWNKTFTVAGKSHEVFYCAGNGGNSIFVFQDLPLVIVITATAYGAPYAHRQVHKMVEEYLLPAILH